MHYRYLNESQLMVKCDPKELLPSDFGLINGLINAVRVKKSIRIMLSLTLSASSKINGAWNWRL